MLRRRRALNQELPSVSPRKSNSGRDTRDENKSIINVDLVANIVLAAWIIVILIGYLTGNNNLLKWVIPVEFLGKLHFQWQLLTLVGDPLPNLDHLEDILHKWHEEALGLDVVSEIASKTPQSGPIPSILWLSSCKEVTVTSDSVRLCENNQQSTNKLYEKFTVKYLTVEQCTLLIHEVEPQLVDPYLAEDSMDHKSAICRFAALFLEGGYYLDVELQTLEALVDRSEVSFIAAVMEHGKGMFPAFLASTPRHPVLEHAIHQLQLHYKLAFKKFDYENDTRYKKAHAALPELEHFAQLEEATKKSESQQAEHDQDESHNMDDYYRAIYDDDMWTGGGSGSQRVGYMDHSYLAQLRSHDPGWRLGTHTLRQAFALLPKSAQGNFRLLQEINLGSVPRNLEDTSHMYYKRQAWYPKVERRVSPSDKCCCNFVLHDPRTLTVHFYSRYVGSIYC